MRAREMMAQLRYHWGDRYEFTVADGRYMATARFGRRDVLEAADPEDLLGQVRRHYRPDILEERCST